MNHSLEFLNDQQHQMSLDIRRLICSINLIVALSCVIGCGDTSEKKFIPTANVAQAALETALEHWKSGNPYGTVDGYDVPIDVLDARWKSGKKLESFEILGEEQSEGPKIFTVKMKLDEEKEEKVVKYYVFGKDPLHIWSEPDYRKSTGS